MSGVAILTTSEKVTQKVSKARSRGPTGKDNYLAVVAGVPRYNNSEVKLGFKLEEDPTKGKRVSVCKKLNKGLGK